MTHTQELVDSLRKQYTLNNDGGGLDGRCRVSNKDLLELLRLAEHAEQQNAELKEQSSRLANESVRQAQQNADLCVKNAELLDAVRKSQSAANKIRVLLMMDNSLSAGKIRGHLATIQVECGLANEVIAKAGGEA